MVAEDGANLPGSFSLPSTTPLLATSPIPKAQLFPIPSWKPASGRNRDYHEFRRGVVQLANALGLSESQLSDAAPTIETLLRQSSVIVTRSEDKLALEAERVRCEGIIEQWQRVNTVLYWHMLPAILLEGASLRRHRRHLDSLVKGPKAAGRHLLAWCEKQADVSGRVQQSDLLRTISGCKLRETASVNQLVSHIEFLYEHWSLLTSSNPDELQSFYEWLVLSLGAVKDGTSLALLRIWLAGEVRKYAIDAAPLLATFDSM